MKQHSFHKPCADSNNRHHNHNTIRASPSPPGHHHGNHMKQQQQQRYQTSPTPPQPGGSRLLFQKITEENHRNEKLRVEVDDLRRSYQSSQGGVICFGLRKCSTAFVMLMLKIPELHLGDLDLTFVLALPLNVNFIKHCCV